MSLVRATFGSLASRNLRMFLTGQMVSVTGTWLQKAAQALLVLELSGSGTLLGVTAALQQLPTLLFGMWGGLLADRMDKRRLLLVTQSASIAPAIALGVLTATGLIQLWMVLLLALLLGTVEALDKPARHTLIADLAGREQITNAVTLNATVQNLGKVVGPAVAGVLIAGVGIPVTFFINAASFLAVILSLLLLNVAQIQRREPKPRARGQLREGLRYVRRTPELFGPLMLMAVTGTLAYEWQVMIPLLAHDAYAEDARIFGLMFSAMGVGAVVGGLVLAGLLRASGVGLVVAGLAFAAVLLAVALSPGLALTLAALFLLGAASMAFRAVASSHVQLTADPAMQGRVMALLIVAFAGTTPFGGPLVGWIGDMLGARALFAVAAVGTAVAAVATLLYMRRRGAPRRGSPSETVANPSPARVSS